MKTFNTGKITFEYPSNWEVEKADILSNPDCIATLSKGQDNLINAVHFRPPPLWMTTRYSWRMRFQMMVG